VPTLTRLILTVDPRSWQVRQAVVFDQFENTVTMKFSKVAVNSGLADRLFTFVPPPGVATVPLR
jgi:outer membrane lipoprotein-sorting protein